MKINFTLNAKPVSVDALLTVLARHGSQDSAAEPPATAEPEVDPANAKHFTVACPDAAGNEVVIYHFEQTRAGWKFTGMDNLNE